MSHREIILVNAGNSTVQISVWDGECMGAVEQFQTVEAAARLAASPLIRQRQERPCLVASVTPAVDLILGDMIPADRLHTLDADMPRDVDFTMVDRITLGADRVANAVAAVHLLRLPAVVVDCGTAITTEVVDASRRFRGGCIIPGRRMSRAALAEKTGKLPYIELCADPPPVVGTTTADAIRSGIDLGTLGAVTMILKRIADGFGTPVEAVAVGGDAAYFARHLPDLKNGPEHFTLRGLAFVANTLFSGCR